ncbi:hypothetical protein COY48_02180 [Candidatus Collierbacteria bacterium CG_4_10_14_0_8_um_filter_43_86]|nr:MAG: hypothetical protein COY48_02180 [Candidatus Collierbacteria bacterium CG_4_10_14_0_8_um_filter_43_86]
MNWLLKKLGLTTTSEADATLADAVKSERIETVEAAQVLVPMLKTLARDGKRTSAKKFIEIAAAREALDLEEELNQELADAARKILGR